MRIAQIAPLFEPVAPTGYGGTYGGTERVMFGLIEELVRRCHDVTLFTSGDSRTSGGLIPCVPAALRLAPDVVDPTAPHIAELARISALVEEFDIVHSHVDYLAYPFRRHWSTPTVSTLHGRLDAPELQLGYDGYPDVRLMSISHRQRAPLAAASAGSPPSITGSTRVNFPPRGGLATT